MENKSWVEQIYDYVEFYYWEPQHLGKQSNKKLSGKESLNRFKEKLRTQEVPLNVLFNLMFTFSPSKLKKNILSCFTNLNFEDVSIKDFKEACPSTDLKGVLQPDVTITSKEYSGFIELKINANLHLDQVYKYIYGHAIWKTKKPFLFFLTKENLFKQWKPSERDELFVGKELNLLSYLKQKSLHKKLGGVDVSPYHLEMKKVINKLELGWADWNKLYSVIYDFKSLEENSSNEMLQTLLGDFLAELNERFDVGLTRTNS